MRKYSLCQRVLWGKLFKNQKVRLEYSNVEVADDFTESTCGRVIALNPSCA